MSENTEISWADHTWTPVVGCDAVSPACAFCYAALMAARLEAMGMAKYAGLATRHGNIGKWTGKVTVWEPEIDRPLSVKKPGRWFLTSMGDVGHEKVSFEILDRLFSVMGLAEYHEFYVLTKRPENLLAYLKTRCEPEELKNVIIGCTAEDQERADERRPHMAAISAMGWRTMVSYEPALGPVIWNGWEFLKWIVGGGESGAKARPMHPDWQRDTRDWCDEHDIPYHLKQNGVWAPGENVPSETKGRKQNATLIDGAWVFDESNMSDPEDGWMDDIDVYRIGKKAAGRHLDGRTHDGMPGDRA